jgi:aspartyl-tRNA(Asn)/glutamyl-tRNA(Gln) amidotransferase subunit A
VTFAYRTARALADDVAAGRATSEAIVAAALERIARHDPALHACLAVADRERALDAARAQDRLRAAGRAPSRLAGIPILIKDNMTTRAFPTTCGSRILEGYRPPYDAAVVERLAAAGLVLLGKTNMDEFAMGSSTENSAFGPTRNPWDLERVPGGSSGGSAAAVAAGLVPLALGSDTGGSVRQPASLCGIVGMKPSYGRVSRYGLVAFASSLDQISPFARSVEDVALLLEVIAGRDARDATSREDAVPRYADALGAGAANGEGLRGVRIGVPREYFVEGLDAEVEAAVRRALDVARAAGATVHDVSLPHLGYGIATYYLIATAEASSNLARFDGVKYGLRVGADAGLRGMYRATRREGFGAEVKRRILLGTFALSSGYYDAYYGRAQAVRDRIRRDFARAFEDVDLLLGPTAPTPAFRIGEKTADPLTMYLSDIYTLPANLAELPGISIPAGLSGAGLPIGMQVLARAFDETRLLAAAHALEARLEAAAARPPRFPENA